MKIGEVYNTIPNAPQCHCSIVEKLADDSLICAFFAGQHEKARDVAIYAAFGDSTGEKWSPPRIIANTPNHSNGSPVFYQDPTGRLHLFYLTMHHGKVIGEGWSVCTIKQKYSDDGGYSWSDWTWLRKNWFWVLRSRALRLKNDSVLLPVHREMFKYQSMFYINPSPTLEGKWQRYGRLKTPHGCLEPSVCELEDGTLVCSLRTAGDGNVFFTRSEDHGHHWTIPERSEFYNPNSQATIFCTSQNKLVLVLNNAKQGRFVLSYAVSDDNAISWSTPETIEGSPERPEFGAGYSYPSITELATGEILVSYTHLRTQIFWAKFRV